MSTQLPAGSAAAARRVTSSCWDFTLDGVKFRVVCRGNLEIGLESDTQVGLLAIYAFCLSTGISYMHTLNILHDYNTSMNQIIPLYYLLVLFLTALKKHD